MAVEFMDFHKEELPNVKATKKMGFDFFKDESPAPDSVKMIPSLEELKQEEDKLKADKEQLNKEIAEFKASQEPPKNKGGRPKKVLE